MFTVTAFCLIEKAIGVYLAASWERAKAVHRCHKPTIHCITVGAFYPHHKLSITLGVRSCPSSQPLSNIKIEDCWGHSEPREIHVTVICWTKWGTVVHLWSDSPHQKAITVTHSVHIHHILFDRESYWCLSSGGFLRKGQSCPPLSQADHPLQYVGCFLFPSQAVHCRPSQS